MLCLVQLRKYTHKYFLTMKQAIQGLYKKHGTLPMRMPCFACDNVVIVF